MPSNLNPGMGTFGQSLINTGRSQTGANIGGLSSSSNTFAIESKGVQELHQDLVKIIGDITTLTASVKTLATHLEAAGTAGKSMTAGLGAGVAGTKSTITAAPFGIPTGWGAASEGNDSWY